MGTFNVDYFVCTRTILMSKYFCRLWQPMKIKHMKCTFYMQANTLPQFMHICIHYKAKEEWTADHQCLDAWSSVSDDWPSSRETLSNTAKLCVHSSFALYSSSVFIDIEPCSRSDNLSIDLYMHTLWYLHSQLLQCFCLVRVTVHEDTQSCTITCLGSHERLPFARKEIVSHPGIAKLRAVAIHSPGPINLPKLHLQLGIPQTHFSDKEDGEKARRWNCAAVMEKAD